MGNSKLVTACMAFWFAVACGADPEPPSSGTSECLQTGENLPIQHRTALPELTADSRIVGLAANDDSVAYLSYEFPAGDATRCMAHLTTLDHEALWRHETIVTANAAFEIDCSRSAGAPLLGLSWDGARFITLGKCSDGARQAVLSIELGGSSAVATAELFCVDALATGLAAATDTLYLLGSNGVIQPLAYPSGAAGGEPISAGDFNVQPAQGLSYENGVLWLGRDPFEANMTYHLTRIAANGGLCTYAVENDTGVRAEFPAAYGSEVWVVENLSRDGRPATDLLWLQDGAE